MNFEFPPDIWVQTPLPVTHGQYQDDSWADWTWPENIAAWAWSQQLSYWRSQPPDDLLTTVGRVYGRSALVLGPISWIFECLASTPTRPSPGQPLAIPGSDLSARNPPWEVLPMHSQWWHWVAYAAIGRLGGEREWELVPSDVWRSIRQACHPQFTWQKVARLLRLTLTGETNEAHGTPLLPHYWSPQPLDTCGERI